MRGADSAPDFFGSDGHVDVGNGERAQRVDDGVMIAASAPTLPASPAPLTPSGLVLVGTGFSAISKEQTSSARGRP